MILPPSVFSYTKLSQLQTVNDPAQPLNTLPGHKQEEVWARLAEIVYLAKSMYMFPYYPPVLRYNLRMC